MKKILIISLLFIFSFLNKSVLASSTSSDMFYTPSLATENLNQNINTLTNDAIQYNMNLSDELNKLQSDKTQNQSFESTMTNKQLKEQQRKAIQEDIEAQKKKTQWWREENRNQDWWFYFAK